MSQHTRRAAVGIISATAVGIALAGCAGGGGGGTEVVFGNSFQADHPHNECGVDVVAEQVNSEDVGLEIVNYPESALGGDQERFRSVQAGDVQMNLDSPSNISAFSEPIGLLDRAFVLDGPEQLHAFVETDAYQDLTDQVLEDSGVRIIGAWYFGMRVFTANKAIREPGDLQGLKTRFPNKPEYLESAKALGANPVGVSFDELYLALQQGTADSQENPVSSTASSQPAGGAGRHLAHGTPDEHRVRGRLRRLLAGPHRRAARDDPDGRRRRDRAGRAVRHRRGGRASSRNGPTTA